MSQERILVVEDDVDVNNLITTILSKNEYQVVQAFSGSEALLQVSMSEFHIIILDLMIPGLTGEELIKKTREKKETPILVISAKIALEDKVNVLNLGADDYMTKPFESEEVIARVNSLLRRYRKYTTQADERCNYTFKNLTLEQESRHVEVNGVAINLTKYEFDILFILLKNPNKVYSRDQLYEQVWDNGYYGEDNSVNVHVSNIRKKIKQIAGEEEYIKTVWGIGFKLSSE